MSLLRLDCGTPQPPTPVNQRFSDTYAFGDLKIQFVFSCYLIKHDGEYMLWDTGHSMTAPNVAPKVSVVDQLAKVDVKPDQIKYVGISHYHADHTGQVELVSESNPADRRQGMGSDHSPQPGSGRELQAVRELDQGRQQGRAAGNRQGRVRRWHVIVLRTPGHTPGHQSLLVKLGQMGPVIITGDAVHFHENYDSDGVPWFNFDRAQTVASIERIKKIAANLKGKVIIQHDARDIDKLPAFPAFAK